MDQTKEKRPDGFMVYPDHLAVVQALDAEARWRLIMALAAYHADGELPQGEDSFFMACFTLMKNGIDRQMSRYRKICEVNREKAKIRWNDRQTNAAACRGMLRQPTDADDANQTKPNVTEPNETEPNGAHGGQTIASLLSSFASSHSDAGAMMGKEDGFEDVYAPM